MLYEPRESINPRTFALRHALLEELKLRQRRADEPGRAPLAELARALDVSYETAGRQFVVLGSHGASCQVALTDVRLYEARADAAGSSWQREDDILKANRRLAASVIDRLLAAARGGTP